MGNIKKRILSAAVSACLLFGSAAFLPENVFTQSTGITASAVSTYKGFKYVVESEEVIRTRDLPSHIRITGYTGDPTSLVIPDHIEGLPVMDIENQLFNECTKLTKVTLPSTLVEYDGLFNDNEYIKEVVISEGVCNISKSAFEHCPNLTKVTLPSTLECIGYSAFSRCEKLENITIPSSVQFIGEQAFYGCKSLKSATIPSGVEVLSAKAFESCSSLSSVTLKKGLKTIGPAAFQYCESLKSITIPQGVTQIQSGAFDGCSALASINVPSTLKKANKCFDETAWYKDLKAKSGTLVMIGTILYEVKPTNATSIILPDDTTCIANDAFRDNDWNDLDYSSITSIILNDKLEEIGDFAFSETSIKKLNIPKSVKVISDRKIVPDDTVVTVDSGNTDFVICDGGLYNYNKTVLYHYPSNIKPSGNTLPIVVKTIAVRAFEGNTAITELKLPVMLTEIGSQAFYNCPNLKKLTVPASVQTMQYNSFGEKSGSAVVNSNFVCLGYEGSAAQKHCSTYHIAFESLGECSHENTFLETRYSEGDRCLQYTNNYTRCSACGEVLKNSSSSTEQHKYIQFHSYVPASCDHYGYSYVFCKKDGRIIWIKSDKLSHVYSDWETIKEPTCSEYGQQQKVCKRCGDKKTEYINPIAHVISGTPTWRWNDTYTLAFPSFTCTKCGYTVTKTATNITSEEYSADCTHYGGKAYTAQYYMTFSNGSSKNFKNTVKVDDANRKPLGHSWGSVTYTWSKDYSSCTAKRVCTRDSSHVITETVKTTAKTKAATCTANGTKTYTTAKFKNSVFKAQTKTVTLKALGHKMGNWKTTSFNVDKKTSVQTRKCTRGDKTETKTVKNAIVRYAGSDRAETATLIANALKGGNTKTSDTVIIATGFDFHDALAAVPLASAYNAPLLLADRDNISAKTLAKIKSLKPKNIIVVATTTAKDQNGYDAAIKSKVYKQLSSYKVTKLTGSNYYATAKKVAEKLQNKKGKVPTSVFITTDKNYADALSASPVAAILGAPIIYVKPTGNLDSNTKNYLASIKKSVKNVYIVGGVNAVSKSVEKSVLSVLGKKSATRFAGSDRYETCIKINKTFAKTLTGKSVCIAKGYNFPDALAGGVFAAQQKAPLFLADKLDNNATISKTQASYLKTKNANKLYIFGGETAIPTALVKTIAKASV